MQYLPWFFFGCNTHKGLNDFFSQKLFESRLLFFYTSKYGTWRFFRKKIKFFSSRVFQTSNMALQKIILTSFFFFFSSSSSRSRAMRSPRHNFSKILSNRNEILQTCSGTNVVVPNTFWVYSVEECRSWGTSKWKNILRFSPCFFRQSFKHRDFHEDIYLQNPNGWTDFDAQ